MAEEFITKILPPKTQPGLIERVRLHELAAGFDYIKAIVFIAPAGYGKTVYMSQLAAKIGKPVVWYHVDPEDNDPIIFFQYLKAALQRVTPGLDTGLFPINGAGELKAKIRLLTAMFINHLALKTDGITIAFDDFHAISNPVIIHFMRELFHYLPSNIHLLLTSRTPLPFIPAKLLASKEILLLSADDLRFDRQEIAAYIKQLKKNPADPTQIERLHIITEGWPVALRLAIEAHASLRSFSTEKQVLFDYLATEVLAQLPGETREFLLTTSVLEVLTPELCAQLTGRADAQLILSGLMKEQLFITQLSAEKNIYRYHQLFREFLQLQLGEDCSRFTYQAALLLRSQGEWEQALRYFMAAGAKAEMAAMVVKAGRAALNNGRWQTVLNWIQSLPPDLVEANPWLLLYRAEIEIFRGYIETAEKLARKAADLFMAMGEKSGLTQSKILQARVLRCRGMFFQSLKLLTECAPFLPAQDHDQRLDLLMEKAVSLYLTGSLTEAEELLTSALDKAKSRSNHYLLPYILEGLGNVHYLKGNYIKAMYYFKKGMDYSPEGFLPGYHTQDHMSMIYEDWGELQKALELAKQNVTCKEKLGMVDTLPSAYTHLAEVQTNLGYYQEAEANYQKAISLLQEINGERTYLALSFAFYARCLWLQGKMVEAKANIERALAFHEIKDSLCYSSCQTVGGLILYQAGETKEGERILLEAVTALEKQGFTKALAYAFQALAALYFAEGDQSKFQFYAKKALTLSARINYVQNFLTCFEVFAPILRAGIEHNIELSFVQRIILRSGARAHSILTPLLKHPDPEVRKRVCAPLAELRDEQGKKGLFLLAQDSEGDVRKVASRFLAKLPQPLGRNQALKEDCHIKLQTLGALHVFVNGTEISDTKWRTRKAKHLLVYLAHHGEAISKEKIIDDLWPEAQGEDLDALFHTTLYRLRQALNLPEKIVTYKGGRYQLDPGCYQTDQAEFEKLIQTASRPDRTLEETILFLEQATALYRGNYLTELDYPWLLPLQERLRHLYIDAQIKLGRYYLEKRNHSQAIFHLRPLLDLSDFSEEIHALLMKAYAGLGDLKAVHKQFKTLTALFREELGLSPSPEIIDLYYKLISKTYSL